MTCTLYAARPVSSPDLSLWRYGTGFGALWFSPFGPLQAFVGFPLDKLEVEDGLVFEFSVGGAPL